MDRDGVLTKEKGYVDSGDGLEVFPYVAECIEEIHAKGYYAIVVTNQSGVARGLIREEKLQEMNELLIMWTGVDAVYYCPHHPAGKIAEFRKTCNCRKPGTGMFEAAKERFSIDMEKSYMVGDRACDIMAGQNAGVRTVLLESGYGTAGLEERIEPDYVLDDLRDVVKILL